MKRALSLLIAAVLCLTVSVNAVPHGSAADGNSCGDELYWTYDATSGVLTITGSGTMTDFVDDPPWYSVASEITAISLPEGLTSIGASAFIGCSSLNAIVIPEGVTVIQEAAFSNCTSLCEITLPISLTYINFGAFYNCTSLSSIYYGGTEEDRNNIQIDYNNNFNNALRNAEWHCQESQMPEPQPCGDKTDWVFDRNTGTLTIGGEGPTWDFTADTIPWNAYCDSIVSVVIEGGVTGIGEAAFSTITNLRVLEIGSDVETIGRQAFANNINLTEVCIPASVTSIGDRAFGCDGSTVAALKRATFLGNPPTMGADVFDNARKNFKIIYPDELVSAWAPNGETTWNGYPINSVSEAEAAVIMCGDDLAWSLDESTGTLTISGTGDMWDFEYADAPWNDYRGQICNVVIESGVTSVGQYAFTDHYMLSTVSFPDTLVEIGKAAFNWCDGISTLVIPDSVTTIGYGAFAMLSSLESLTLGSGVREIGPYAFQNDLCLTEIEIPESVTTIGDRAFDACDGFTISLTHAMFLGNPPTMGYNVFGDAPQGFVVIYPDELESVWAPNGETIWNGYPIKSVSQSETMGEPCGDNLTWTFNVGTEVLTITGTGEMDNWWSGGEPWADIRYQIKSIVIEEGATSIGTDAFWDCANLISVTIPASVKTIGEQAFFNCHRLRSVSLAAGLETIEAEAFWSCYDLQSIRIPEGVITIDRDAFRACNSLTTVTLPSTLVNYGTRVFSTCKNLTEILVADGNENYRSENGVLFSKDGTVLIAYPNGRQQESCAVPEGVVTIANDSFRESVYLKSVSIPSSVRTVGEFAFYYCCKLNTVTFAEGTTHIGIGAFYECPCLTEMVVPEGVTVIDIAAFQDCTGLRSITIPSTVTTIGIDAFSGCFALESADLPASLETVGERAFFNCAKLTTAVFGDRVTRIGEEAFRSCDALTTVVFGAGVANIEPYAFADCYDLESVRFTGNAPDDCGEGIFTSTAQNFRIYYDGQYRDSWAPNGETKWNGYPIYAIYDGTCGEHTEWTFSEETGTLTVSGSGPMSWTEGASTNSQSAVTRNARNAGSAPWSICNALIKTAVIEYGVTSINSNAFASCAQLTAVTIPATVNTIADGAFQSCDNLTALYMQGEPPQNATVNAFDNTANTLQIYYPQDQAQTWTDHADATSGENLTWNGVSIGQKVFTGTFGGNLTWTFDNEGFVLTISGAAAIPDFEANAAYPWADYADSVASVAVQSGVTAIGANAFATCTNAKSVEIPHSVVTIGANAYPDAVETVNYLGTPNTRNEMTIDGSVRDIGTWSYLSLKGISLSAMPDKILYYQYENICMDGAVLRLDYGDGIIELGDINDAEISGSTDSAGEASVKVVYQNEVTRFNITVKEYGPEFSTYAMRLSSEIGVKFKVLYPDGDMSDVYVNFMVSDGRTETMTFAEAEKIEGENACYFICYINALELADTITATMYKGDRIVVDTYSAMKYIDAQKRIGNKKTVNLVTALQDYGYYLQASGWTDNMQHKAISKATDVGDDEIAAARAAVSEMQINKNLNGVLTDAKFSLTLNAQTKVNVFVKPGDDVTISDGYVGTKQIGGDTYYQFTSLPIGPLNLANPVVITIETNCGNATITASPMSYVYEAVKTGTSFSFAKQQAMAAFYRYYAVADAFVKPEQP